MANLKNLNVSEKEIKYGLYGLIGAFIVHKLFHFALGIRRGIQWRMTFRKMKNQGLPMPPHHWLFGHLKFMGEVAQKMPLDVHPHVNLPLVFEGANATDTGVCYVDFWPISNPMIIISEPHISAQATQQPSLDKSQSALETVLIPLTGPGNMAQANGPEWRFWRTVFNPGYSAGHIMTLVPGIVKDCMVFCDILKKKAATGEVVNMEKACTCLTVDIIGRVVLDAELDTQHKSHPLIEAFKSQIRWLKDVMDYNPWNRWHPLRPLMFWYNKRIMRKIVGDMLDERFLRRDPSFNDGKRSKPIIDLALETYFKEKGTKFGKMDNEFRELAITQMMLFLFAGHDTTSSTICYIFYQLAKHPEKMARARQEIEDIFGPDVNDTGRLLCENPRLINQMEYNTAVIREVLRLFPPASTLRQGTKEAILKDPRNGELYPTENLVVWVNHFDVHRKKTIWGEDANEFRPERFLEPECPKDGWRPFERGPRNCIGQELAMIETKVIMAMALRLFDVTAQPLPAPMNGINEAWGERLYQQLQGTGKPKHGMPSIVKMATRIV